MPVEHAAPNVAFHQSRRLIVAPAAAVNACWVACLLANPAGSKQRESESAWRLKANRS